MTTSRIESKAGLALIEFGFIVARKANHSGGWDAKPRALANESRSRQPGCRLYTGGSDGKAIGIGYLG